LVNLYAQLTQRQYAADQFNKGLALFLGGFKGPPGGLQTMVDASQGMAGPDPSVTFGNMLRIQQMQTELGQRQQLMGSASDLAARTGMPEALVRSMIATGQMGDLERAAMPTDLMRNYNSAQQLWLQQNPGKTPADFAAAMPIDTFMMAGMGGGDIMSKQFLVEQAQFRKDHPNDPLPPELQDLPSWNAYKAGKLDQAKDVQAGKANLPTLTQKIDETLRNVDAIRNDPNLDSVVGGQWLPSTGWLASQVRSPGVLKLAGDIQQLGGQVYGEGFRDAGQGGSRRSTAEVAGLVNGLSQINNTYLPAGAYRDQLDLLRSQLMRAKANAYGSAGLEPPDALAGMIDPSFYAQGGTLFGKTPPKQLQATPQGGQQQAGGPIAVMTPDDVRRLPSGTPFIVPSGPHKGETRYAP
jgi:hypothetical protein